MRKDSTQLRQGGTRKRRGICRQIGHRRNGCPQAPKEPPTQPPTGSSQQSQPPTQGPGTEQPIHTPAEAPTESPGTQPPIQSTTEAANDTPIQPPTEALPGPQQPIQQPSTTTIPTTQIEPGATQQSQAPPPRTNLRPKLAFKRGPIWKP